MKIYVASSWRNRFVGSAVRRLKKAGHEVYDFRKNNGFAWSNVDKNWKAWDFAAYRDGLRDPLAMKGYANDMLALQMADAVVLVLPCGRSAHIEAGYAAGNGQRLLIWLPEMMEPELMYSMADCVSDDLEEIVSALGRMG